MWCACKWGFTRTFPNGQRSGTISLNPSVGVAGRTDDSETAAAHSSQSSHGLLPPSVISNSYRPVGLQGFFLWPPWWLPGTASEKYAVNVDRAQLTANICWVKHLRSVVEIDFRGTLSTSAAFFHPPETYLWEFSLHWLSSPLIVALHRGVFKKTGKKGERGTDWF